MKKIEKIRKQILDAKEDRWNLQKKILQDSNDITLIIYKFNIPSWPKNSLNISKAFNLSLNDFENFLSEKGIAIGKKISINTVLGPVTFFTIDTLASEIKKLTIDFEENHKIGRLLDIDVISDKFLPIERKIKRRCFICERTAIDCMRNKTHSPSKAREYFDIKIKNYL